MKILKNRCDQMRPTAFFFHFFVFLKGVLANEYFFKFFSQNSEFTFKIEKSEKKVTQSIMLWNAKIIIIFYSKDLLP